MIAYILRRLLMLVPVLFGVVLVSFSLLHLVPGDPAEILAGQEATKEAVDRIRAEYGLDQPLIFQFGRFVWNASRGDLGISIQTRHPVRELLFQRLGFTLQLSLASILVASTIGLLAGIISSTRQYSFFDTASMLGALFGISMPIFWLGLLLILVFAVQLRWLPSIGAGTPLHLVAPALTLSGFITAKLARMIRSGMLEVLGQDYIRTAEAKGLSAARIVTKHAVRNMLIPIVTILGMELSFLLGGAVIVETVFAWPGLGRQLITAVLARDYPVVQATVFVVALVAVALNLLVDLFYRVLDPRVQYQ